MRSLGAALLSVVSLACKSEPVPPPPAPSAPLAVTASAPMPRLTPPVASESASDGSPGGSAASPPVRLAANGCKVDADCVLTAEPTDCCACPLDHEYPAAKHALDAHQAGCATADCRLPSACPPVVRYQPAFDRAECREGRCVVVRWHSGG